MKKTFQYIVPALLALIISESAICWGALDISVSGDWSETIDASDLQAGAGSDLIDTYESVSEQVSIDITKAREKNWRVDVKKIDDNWHSDFQLSVKRTSDGTGPGSISGGTSYLEVTDIDQSFFNGYEDKREIYVQLKLSGVSIQVPPDVYITTVYYTVVEI